MSQAISDLPDEELIERFRESVMNEHEELVRQLEHLAEMDRRKLFFGYSSLWAYVVHEHGLEEWTSERRIRAARIMRRFPEVRRGLELGKLNLSLLEIAQSCASREKLSDAEFREVLEAVAGKSCRAARREVAILYPSNEPELPRDRIRPLTEELSEVRFVASQALLDQLEEIRGLLAHSHPGATLAEVIGEMARDYRERHHPEAKAARAAPATLQVVQYSTSNRVPTQSIVHELVRRQGYVCSYVDPVTKMRCSSKHGLEIDHIQAWADGGKTSLENLRFLCAGHHRRVSFLRFGDRETAYDRS